MNFANVKKPLRVLVHIVFVFVILCAPSTTNAYTLPPEQLKVIREGIKYYNTEESLSCAATVSMRLPATAPEAYRTLFEQAGAKHSVNPALIAAMFVTEHGNSWPDPAGPWASSSKGASGPFQFMPGTWSAYGQGGNIQNLEESTYAAARLIKALGGTTNTPIGTLEKPYTRDPNTAMYIGVAYNAGSGSAEQHTSPASGVTGDGKLAPETVNYAKNIYHLLTSGFVHGNPGYGSAEGTVTNKASGATSSVTGTGSTSASSCASASQGSVVGLAKNLAWPEKGGHGKEKSDATKTYQDTMPTVHTSLVNDIWSDCGAFVSTVMRASGADRDYLLRGTGNIAEKRGQIYYAYTHPEKYEVINNVTDTAQFQPGDVIIYDKGHTIVYLGTGIINGYNAADASWHDHVPTAQNAYIENGGTHIIRLKKA